MPPALLTADRIVYRSRMTIASSATPGLGDLRYGRGLAARYEGGVLTFYLGSFNPQVVGAFSAPASLNGALTFTQVVGSLQKGDELRGLFWDAETSRLYQNSGYNYDSSSAQAPTISRGSINPSTGQLVGEGFWTFAFSDKRTSGGVTAIPEWWRTLYTPTRRLGVGFGGYWSVATVGPVSMGPSLAAFAPPTTGTVAVTALQGYPYANYPAARQHRPTNYTNDPNSMADGYPRNPTLLGTGYWTWGDNIYQAGSWVDTAGYSGMVYCGTLGIGRIAYGSPTPSQVNAQGAAHVWFITNPTDLAAVTQGASPSSIQSAFTPVQFPGVTYPLVGNPFQYSGMIVGSAWVPELGVLFLRVRNPTGSVSLPIILAFDVAGGVTPPTPAALVIATTSPLPNGTIATQYTGSTFQATGGVPPYTWTQTGGPAGIALTTAGVYQGTPTVSGSFTVAATVTDSQPASTNKGLALSIAAPAPAALVIVTTSLGNGQENVPYSVTLVASGGVAPRTWVITGLPAGLTGSSAGVISGTPVAPSVSSVQATVTDAQPVSTGPNTLPLTIVAAPVIPPTPPALVVSTSSLPGGTVGTAYTPTTLTATGGVLPYQWSASTLPTGLTLSTTGVLTGMPSVEGTFATIATVTDAQPVSTPASLPITIAAAPIQPSTLAITTATLPAGAVGAAYSTTIAASGGTPPYTFSALILPANLSMSPTGELSGVPSEAFSQTISLTVQDSRNPPAEVGVDRLLTITGPPPVPSDPPPGVPLIYLPQNFATNVQATTTNGDVIRWWAVKNVTTYQVYHGTTPNPPLVATITASTSTRKAPYPAGTFYYPVVRAAHTTYYWKVVAVGTGGITTTSTWRYTTK